MISEPTKQYIKTKLKGRTNWSIWSTGMRWDLKKIKKETNDGKSTVSAWMLVDGQVKKSNRTIEMQEFEALNKLATAGIYEALGDGP